MQTCTANTTEGDLVSVAKACRARGRLLTLVTAALVMVGAMAMTSAAYAVEHHPKGEFAPFADCPLSNPAVSTCLVATTESGEFVIGKETVPIAKVVTLQGGIHAFLSGEETVVGAEDGNTLSKTPQKVPGGLAGLVKCNEISNFLERLACELVFENGVTGVNATTELAAPATSIGLHAFNLLGATGTALSLPVKVHLENPFLGSSCYIGSNAAPIVIELTTGTTSPPPPNKPISGFPGEPTFSESGLLTIKNNALVNNTFAAPKSEGCGGLFAFLIGPIIDSRLALPSAAGHNTAILKGTMKLAPVEAVKASE
jgi:hypothetical protein